MKTLGTALTIFGLLLIIFQIAGCKGDRPSALTDWMSNWGDGASWAIKIGMVVIGLVLIFSSDRKSK